MNNPSNPTRKNENTRLRHSGASNSFEAMGLREELLRGMYAYGFENPSAIQRRAIFPILSGRDVVAQAQSGTGKTSMIAIVACQLLDLSNREVQVIILSPTRELAVQTQKVSLAVGEHLRVRAYACVGGTSVMDDVHALNNGAHIVSGTPGRIYDLIKRGSLRAREVKTLVLDEADEMLSKGFKEQVYDVYRYLHSETQVVLLSATILQGVLDVVHAFMSDPVQVLIKRDELTLEGINQYFIAVEREEWKFDTLCDIYDSLTISQAVIFCNTRQKVDWLSIKMRENAFTVSAMHGDMPQRERNSIMTEFRCGATRVLITTDVWARGLDVQQITLVVNYDLPVSRETYLHRIGRSGRYGRKGVAINLARTEDIRVIRDIEQFYSTEIVEMPRDIADIV
mmetsp:Transcript_2906/g.10283  ORF Transcript_2906/g.10283 Transcript_2906/m.10283 type:complete len:397 (+) Transcript_2906:354-1544(+)